MAAFLRASLPSLAALLLVMAAILVVTLAPKDPRIVVVQFAPWTDNETALERIHTVGGYLIRSGRVSGSYVLFSPDPKLPSHLRRAGAWAVLDPAAAAWCGLTSTSVPYTPPFASEARPD